MFKCKICNRERENKYKSVRGKNICNTCNYFFIYHNRYKHNKEFMNKRKEYIKKYNQTKAGKERIKKYISKEENKIKRREYSKLYCIMGKNAIAKRKWREKNPDKQSEYDKTYRTKNLEVSKAKKRLYYYYSCDNPTKHIQKILRDEKIINGAGTIKNLTSIIKVKK